MVRKGKDYEGLVSENQVVGRYWEPQKTDGVNSHILIHTTLCIYIYACTVKAIPVYWHFLHTLQKLIYPLPIANVWGLFLFLVSFFLLNKFIVLQISFHSNKFWNELLSKQNLKRHKINFLSFGLSNRALALFYSSFLIQFFNKL